VVRYPPGSGVALRIDCGHPKAWKARVPGTQTRAAHPGSAVLFEGATYEVVRIETGEDGRAFYYLAPWDDAHTIRQIFELSAESAHKEAQEHQEKRRHEGRGGMLTILLPFVGLLPASDQQRIEREHNLPAATGTVTSAIALLAIATAFFVLATAQSFVPLAAPAWIRSLRPLWLYFFVESAIRLLSGFKLGEPMGSLPVVFPLEAVRALRAAMSGEQRQRRALDPSAAASDRARDGGAVGMMTARDEVLTPRDPRYALEIVSLLPKPHWTANLTGISYRGCYYQLVEREVLADSKPPKHRFLLAAAPEDSFFRSVCEYDPTEVRDLYRQQIKAQKSTWVATFAPLWGLLEPALQERLETSYGLERHTAIRGSLLITGLGGLAGTFTAASLLFSAGEWFDFLVLAASLALLAETAARWKKLERGDFTGSFFGRFLAPFASSLLRL
jgi:hypothetical protein